MTESVNSLKNIFEKNDMSASAPTTPQSTSFASAKKEFQQNSNANDILYRSSVRIKKKNSLVTDNINQGESIERFSKMLDEIDETWNEFEKSNTDYINKNNQLSRNTSSNSLQDKLVDTVMKRRSAISGIPGIPGIKEEDAKQNAEEIKECVSDEDEEQVNEDYKRCQKEMDDVLRNIESYINNYYERKNETSSTESSIESFLEEYSIDSSIKPVSTKEVNVFIRIINSNKFLTLLKIYYLIFIN